MLRRHRLQSIVLTLGPTVFDRHITPFHVASFGQTLAKYRHLRREWPRQSRAEKPDHRQRRLLRLRGERPRRRPAEKSDELAPLPVEHGAPSLRQKNSPRAFLVRSIFNSRRLAAPQYPPASCQ
jgi:hypothetical protein